MCLLSPYCLLYMGLAVNLANALLVNPPTSIESIIGSYNHFQNTSILRFGKPASSLDTSNEIDFGCSGIQYGRGLDVGSCFDALVQLDRTSTKQQSWGSRSRYYDFDFRLPATYWSSDLKCCIIPLLAPGVNWAHASVGEVVVGAARVLQDCVNKEPHRGGMAKDIGPDKGLGVIIAKYVPPPTVKCFGTIGAGSIEKSCLEMLNNIKASRAMTVFSADRSPGSPVVKLPHFEESADKKCVLTINSSGASDVETWERIWEDASLVTAHCIRERKTGSVMGLGKDGRLSVQVTRGFLAPEDQDATA